MCREISREQTVLRIRLETRRYGKAVTIIEGFSGERKNDIRQLASTLKSKLACGGTVKNNAIILQGDHRHKLKRLLIEQGYREDQIEIH